MDRSSGGKNGVNVRRKENDGTGAIGGHAFSRQEAEDIADGVDLDIAQACLNEALGQPLGAFALTVRRSGDGHESHLPIHDGFGIGVEPGECGVNGPLRGEGSDARECRS